MASSPSSQPARLGDRVELQISDLNHRGEGVARLAGQVCFVPGALPQETVRARLRRAARRHWSADLEAVLVASPDRRRPACILADHCGGCSLQHWQDQAQVRWKEDLVRQALQRIGRLEVPLRALIPAADPLGYRNRALIPLQRAADGGLRAGYYRRGSHRIVNMNQCPVLDPRLDALIAPLKRDLEATGWPADSDGAAEAGLRHLALRVGSGTGELLITLISSHSTLPGLDGLVSQWMERWPQLVGVGLNLQSRGGNTVMGDITQTLCGRPWLREHFAGLSLRVAADTFFQVNTAQAERVVPLLLDALADRSPGLLIDAFCGIGTFSLPLARAGWRVRGLERSVAAVRLARHNAADNGLEAHCRFTAVDVAAALNSELEASDALFVDPPRKGLDPATMAAITAMPPPLLLYLSCDPATLARDLGLLCEVAGYRVRWLQPLDFFPQTSHVECLAVLERG